MFRLGIRRCHRLKRYYSTSPYLYINQYQPLHDQIQANLTPESSEKDILHAIESIKNLSKNYSSQDQINSNSKYIKQGSKLIDEIFTNVKQDRISPDFLKQMLLLNLPTSLNLKIINEYYKHNNNDIVVPKSIALIALRHAIYDGDFQNAIKLTDLTVGHPNYINEKQKQLRHSLIKLILSGSLITIFNKFGTSILIDSGVISHFWEHLNSLNSIFLTYILNSGFFITIVKLGRQVITSGGDVLTWQKGTFYNHWYKHGDEMLFAKKIIEADKERNQGESTPSIIEELCRLQPETRESNNGLKPGYDKNGKKIRLLTLKDDLQKLKFQAYWMSGGDGFEWTEPDQDPAELQWRDHLKSFETKPIGDTKFNKLIDNI